MMYSDSLSLSSIGCNTRSIFNQWRFYTVEGSSKNNLTLSAFFFRKQEGLRYQVLLHYEWEKSSESLFYLIWHEYQVSLFFSSVSGYKLFIVNMIFCVLYNCDDFVDGFYEKIAYSITIFLY